MPRCCKGTQGSTARQEAPAGTEMCENRKSLDHGQYTPDEAGSVSRERFPNCQHHPPRSSTRAPNIGEYTVHHPLPTHAAANPTTSAAPPHLTLLRMAVRIRVVKTSRLRRHSRVGPALRADGLWREAGAGVAALHALAAPGPAAGCRSAQGRSSRTEPSESRRRRVVGAEQRGDVLGVGVIRAEGLEADGIGPASECHGLEDVAFRPGDRPG